MKNFIAALGLFAMATPFSMNAQSLHEMGCATVTSPEEIQRIYDFVQHNPAANYKLKAADVTDTIPLSIHIVGTDAGTGFYKQDNLFKVLCNLNEHFAPAHLYFAVQWPVQYISKSSYYEHNFYTGAAMMMANNVANTVNVYFVKDPAGACGYFTSYGDAVAISNNCAAPSSTTLVHELGHFFSLPHTFYGWEGGTMPPNPEKVTRGAGANCNSAGDGFCDTDADWQSERWACPYTGTQTDPVGVPYKPDSSLYMGYPMDGCMSRFSPMQMAAMHYNINTVRTDLYPGPFTAWNELDTPVLVTPVDTMYNNYKILRWQAVAGADQYRVTLAPKYAPNAIKMEVLTADTSVAVAIDLANNGSYRLKVEPMSQVNVCRLHPLLHDFVFSSNEAPLTIAQNALLQSNISISPNPVAGRDVTLSMQEFATGTYEVAILAINGQVLYQTSLQHPGGNKSINLPVSQLSSGMYFVHLSGKQGVWTAKLAVQ